MTQYVVGFAKMGDGRVVLICKNRPAWQAGRINGVGGHVEPGEDAKRAMEREFCEETGAIAAWIEFAILSGIDHEQRPYVVHFFSGRLFPGNEQVKSTTDEQVILCDPRALPENVIPNLRWLIPMSDRSQVHDWPFHITERWQETPDDAAHS
jgi:8-oxo-dGTP diphosphatase